MNNIDKTQPKLAIAVLAAGEASRFGSSKQLAYYQGETFIERSVTLLETVDCEVLIVTGAHHAVINEHLKDISKEQYVVFNQHWQQGMSSSIKAAVNHCPDHCAGMMFVAVDQIHITQEDIQSLINRWQQEPSHIVCADYANHRGIPAIFPRDYFSQLLDLQNDKGARNLIKSSPNVNGVLLPNAEFDIDTKEQLSAQPNHS